MDNKILTTKQFSKEYGLPEGSLANMRWRKIGPRYYKLNKKIIYRRADIEAWLFSNPVLTINALKE